MPLTNEELNRIAMNCGNCGAWIGGVKFCSRCGQASARPQRLGPGLQIFLGAALAGAALLAGFMLYHVWTAGQIVIRLTPVTP
jgi:hypothetical protein